MSQFYPLKGRMEKDKTVEKTLPPNPSLSPPNLSSAYHISASLPTGPTSVYKKKKNQHEEEA